MYKILSKVSIFILVAGITSCATQGGLDTSNLEKSKKSGYIQIAKDINWKSEWKFSKNVNYWQLSAGKYTPVFDSNSGTYYQGEGNCFSLKVRSEKEFVDSSPFDRSNICGIFIPNKKDAGFKVYFIENEEECKSKVNPATSGVVVAAIAHNECDNIKHAFSQPEKGKIEQLTKFIK